MCKYDTLYQKKGESTLQKKSNGEGTVYFSESRKRWIGQITVGTNENGKPKRRSVYGKTKKEVREKMIELQAAVLHKTYVDPSQIKVADYIESLIEEDRRLNIVSESSYNRKKSHLNIIKKYPIANIKLTDVTEAHIKELYEGISDYSESIIKKVVSHIKRCFRESTRIGITKVNIADGIRTPKSKKQTVKVRALTVDEQKKLMNLLSTENIKHGIMYYTMLLTGMRMGEICVLDYFDVNLDFKVITVRRSATLDENDKPIIGNTTKTKAGIRRIPISAQLFPMLRRYAESWEPNKENLFFWDYQADTMIYTTRLNMALHRLFEEYNIIDKTVPGKVSLHSLRHTYATRAIESGVAPKIIMQLLGHSDIKITLNTYCDAFDDYQEHQLINMQSYMESKGLIV